MFPFTLTPTSLNVLYDGKMRTLHASSPNFSRAVALVKAANTIGFVSDKIREEFESIIDVRKFFAKVTFGRLELGDTEARLDGRPITGYVVQRIFDMMKAGFNVEPMARFVVKLYNNPTLDVRGDLYKWLEAGGMPITEDGDFIAFKKVRSDYLSDHDGTTLHVIGEELSMPREACDDNRNNTCSTGLHFCSFEYLKDYKGSSGRVLILKINPEHVVAIPTDYNLSKGRACKYTPIGEIDPSELKDAFRDETVVTAFGTYTSQDEQPDDQDAWHDDEECDDCGFYMDDCQCGTKCDEYYDGSNSEYEDTCNVKADTTYAYSAEDFEEATLFAVEIMDIDRLKATIELAKSNGEFMLAYDLEEAFSWNTTPQGAAFWQDVSVDTLKLAEADIKWLEALYAFSTKNQALIDAAWDTHKNALSPVAVTFDELYAAIDAIDAPQVIFTAPTSELVPVEGVERIDLECLRAVIEGEADHLWNAFFWASAVQGETFWRDRGTKRVAITDADRKWLTRLYEHEQAKAKACPSWVDAMRKDSQS